MIEALLKTGRYQFVCLGGAVKHQNYEPQAVDPHGEDWRIFPIDGYGNHEIVRSVIQKERPDVLWFMTDPRFYEWLWEIENEVRANIPMVYYHVWDNYPAPHFNGVFYRSTDHIACISKVTHDIVQQVAPEVDSTYLPHAVNPDIFRPFKGTEEADVVEELRKQVVGAQDHKNKDKKIFFWNNRNARRKQSGTLIWWFKEFLDEVGHDKAMLFMHTDPRDPHGQDLPHIIKHLGMDQGQVLLSTTKVDQKNLAGMYNMADFTVNIADAEGFGLSTLESLSCGTPIIATMTGGLQEQVTDGENEFGFPLKIESKAVIGSLQVPYIYEDRISQRTFTRAMKNALSISKRRYNKMSIQGRQHVVENYSFDNCENQWVSLMDEIVEKHGSWETRKNYDRWHLVEVA